MTSKHLQYTRLTAAILFTTAASALFSPILAAQAPAQGQTKRNFPAPGGFNAPTPQLQLPPMPTPTPITPSGTVVEDVIARVDDQVITRSEYTRSAQQLIQEGQQQQAPADVITERVNNLLRDMIDQKLLLSKGKQLGITGDAEVIRQLNDIRLKNHFTTMEELEKAAASQGVSFEDFKQSIRNQVIQQQVVRDEVGRRLQMTQSQEKAYYDAHQQDFQVIEQIHLSEILIPTPENATDAQIAAAQTKADAAAAQLAAGGKFAEVAKATSGGPTASAGGDLGDFKRGALGDVLEKATFDLPVGGNTAPIRTRQGFVILHIDAHQKAGIAPMADVEQDIQQALYLDALQPALRAYLTKARNEAYVDIKPGFIDAGSATHTTGKPLFTAYTPPPVKKKIVVKQKAEQEKAARAAAQLAADREKLREKQEAKAAADATKSGVKNVNKPVKPKKIRKEKIRYGQAPRNSLPAGAGLITEAGNDSPTDVSPGAALAGTTTSTTQVSAGTGVDDTDPLASQAPVEKKTRFSKRETEQEVAAAQAKLAKAEVKATTRPVAATREQTQAEKLQAAPLGLSGDTVKKPAKAKKKKGDPKERLKEQPKPVETTTPVAPTTNPKLVAPATGNNAASTPAASDQSAMPSTTSAPGAPPQGQPIPATTSATPGAPTTTPSPK